RIGALNRGADAAMRSANLEVTAQTAQAIVDVTEAYYDALLSARLLEIAEQSLANAEETLRLTELAFEVGDQPEFDVLRARVARNIQRNNITQARANRNIAFNALKQLINVPLSQDIVLTTSFAEDAAPAIQFDALLPEGAADTATDARIPVQ